MLEIEKIEKLNPNNLPIVKRKSKKTQIFLYDTQRRLDDFISKIEHRNNGKFEDIPHFVVSKLGNVYQLYNTDYWSNTFNDPQTDKKQIKIAVENLGWLNKNAITGVLNNWIGDPYRGEPHIRNWRNYYFWDKYNETQLQSISELCEHICDKHNIYKQSVPSQGYFENVTNFKGIVCKSNFSSIYTDINPSFNFGVLFNYANENENRI